MTFRFYLLILLGGVAWVGCQRQSAPQRATFVRVVPWAERGVWLKADTHVHTQFSDGGVELGEVVQRAYANGCDVLALTDHADQELRATSKEYFDALGAAREQFPEMILLAGLEWNVPPWQGREHATVLVSPNGEERLLRAFQTRFDDWGREERDPDLAAKALQWLESSAADPNQFPVVFYNHPSRKRSTVSEFADELRKLRTASSICVGFEGGPGHQDTKPIGAYESALPTVERWDVAAAEIGGAWDQLLQQGTVVWGSLATSDFHNGDPQLRDDYWPGEFSETWLYAEERTPRAALAALRAGTFFGVHGGIAREVQLTAFADGMPRPAIAGEAIHVPTGAPISIALRLNTPLVDWEQNANRVDEVEFVQITPQGTNVVYRATPSFNQPINLVLPMEAGGMMLRARGRRVVANGPDLMFYTNPIEFVAQLPTAEPSEAAESFAVATVPSRPARNVPAWIWLAFIVGCSVSLSLLDRWRIEIGRRFSRDNQQAKVELVTMPHVLQRHLLLALACFVALAVYGSFVPFQWQIATWAGSLQKFVALLQQPLNFDSKTDWATNVILFVPIGFLGTGLALGRVSSDIRRALVPPLVVSLCAALSLFIEGGQLWLADRVASQNDVVAESLGGLIGASAWFLSGAALAAWLDTFRTDQRPRQRLERMLEVYVLAVWASLVLPLDLTLRPAEIYEKWKLGRINLVPFADLAWTTAGLLRLIEQTLLLLPLGVLLALWRWPREDSVRPLGRGLLLGSLLLTVFEASQLLVFSRTSSVTDLLTGLLGLAAGWSLARWRLTSRFLQSPADRWQSSGAAFALAGCYAALVVAVLCLPYDHVCSGAEAGRRWQTLRSSPLLAVFQAGAITNALSEVLRKLMLFGTFGALLGTAVRVFPAGTPERRFTLVAALAAAALLAIGIEFTQLWLPPHVPELSDVALALTGSGLGLFGVLAVAAQVSSSIVAPRPPR